MNDSHKTDASATQRQLLFALCRFLSARFSYRFMLLLTATTGVFLTLLGRTQFAPYGIALLCLILPSFLQDSVINRTQKENSDTLMSALYKRYHYSPVLFTTYRITLLLCALLLFTWHRILQVPLTLFNISIPLLYLVLCLALYPVLSRVFFFLLHRRLMNGSM